MSTKLIIIDAFIASAFYVHYGGRVRHAFWRKVSVSGGAILAARDAECLGCYIASLVSTTHGAMAAASNAKREHMGGIVKLSKNCLFKRP